MDLYGNALKCNAIMIRIYEEMNKPWSYSITQFDSELSMLY